MKFQIDCFVFKQSKINLFLIAFKFCRKDSDIYSFIYMLLFSPCQSSNMFGFGHLA